LRQVALRRESLADQAAAAIQQMIVEGGLAPGDYLPSTGELAERFGVSRTVVREALAELAGRGMIARSQGRESVVANPGVRQLRDLLGFHVRRESIPAVAFADVRRGIEVESAQLAAVRATVEQRQRLRTAMEAAATGGGPYRDGDQAFHRAVAVASHNPLFVLLLDAVAELSTDTAAGQGPGLRCGGRHADRVRAEHGAILEAIERGAAEEAAAAMRRHLTSPIEEG
jgi:GntR family transcriptional repressor for pyruvate dehydrogenase complex